MITFRSQDKGFTLIEAIVAIVILITAISGPIALAGRSLRASLTAQNEMIATYLLEEGFEVMHNMRDNNSAADLTPTHANWLTDIYFNCKVLCIIDATQHNGPGIWASGGASPAILCAPPCTNYTTMYFDPSSGIYQQKASGFGGGWTKTIFNRSYVMTGIDADPPLRQVRITGTITFTGYGGTLRTLTVTRDLYNWFPVLN